MSNQADSLIPFEKENSQSSPTDSQSRLGKDEAENSSPLSKPQESPLSNNVQPRPEQQEIQQLIKPKRSVKILKDSSRKVMDYVEGHIPLKRQTTIRMDRYSVIKNIRTPEYLLPLGFSSFESLHKEFKKLRSQRFENYQIASLPISCHSGKISAVVISSNNEFFITGSADKSINIVNAQDLTVKYHHQNLHKEAIKALSLSSNDDFLVSGDDNCMKIFQISTLKVVKEFPLFANNVPKKPLLGLAYLSESKHIVACLQNRISVFDVSKGWEYDIKIQQNEYNSCLVVSKDEKYAIVGTDYGNVRFYDLKAKKEAFVIDAYDDQIKAMSISKDGKQLVTTDMDRFAKIFNIETKQKVLTLDRIHKREVLTVAMSNDQGYIVSGSIQGNMKIFDLSNKQEVYYFQGCHKGALTKVAFSHDDKFIISASEDGSFRKHAFMQTEKIGDFKDIPITYPLSVKRADNGSILYLGEHESKILLYDPEDKNVIHSFEFEPDYRTIDISEDQRFCLVGYKDGSIKVFDFQDKKLYHTFGGGTPDGPNEEIEKAIITKDNKCIIAFYVSKRTKIFDLENKIMINDFTNNITEISILKVSPNGRYVIIGSTKGGLTIFDTIAKKELYSLFGIHEAYVSSINFTSDSRRFVSASEDGCVAYFDIEIRCLIHRFYEGYVQDGEGEIEQVELATCTAISQDDKYLIVGFSSCAIKVYNLRTKQLVHVYENVQKASKGIDLVLVIENKYIVACSNTDETSSMTVFLAPFSQNNEYFLDTWTMSPYLLAENIEEKFINPMNEVQKTDLLMTYQDLCINPFKWNILHYLAIFKPSILNNFPPYSQMKVPFIIDIYGKTPMHYLLAYDSKKVGYPCLNNMLKYILDYLEENPNLSALSFKYVTNSLSPLFPVIISELNSSLVLRFLEVILRETMTPFGIPLPEFGKNKRIKFTISEDFLMQPHIQHAIYQEGQHDVTFRTLMLRLNYDPSSEDVLDIVLTLSGLQNEDIFKSEAISGLIAYLWAPSKVYHIVMGIFYSALMILLSVYFIIGKVDLVIEIFITILTCMFLISEIIQFVSLRLKHFSTFWNYGDVVFFPLIIAKMIRCFNGGDDELNDSWMFSAIFLLGYLRWVSYLQIFEPTRNLIWLIINVLKDMWAFMLIVSFTIVCSALIFLGFNRESDYSIQIFNTYSLLYGAFDESNFWKSSQKILLSFVLFLLSVVLLNLLISIMGDSYGKFQEKKILTENKTRIEMILEYLIFRRKFKSNKNNVKGYLMSCAPLRSKDKELLFEENEVEAKSNKELENRVSQLEEEMKELRATTQRNHLELLDILKTLKPK